MYIMLRIYNLLRDAMHPVREVPPYNRLDFPPIDAPVRTNAAMSTNHRATYGPCDGMSDNTPIQAYLSTAEPGTGNQSKALLSEVSSDLGIIDLAVPIDERLEVTQRQSQALNVGPKTQTKV